MARLPVALQLYTVRDQTAIDYPGTVAKVAKMGYDGVEFAGRPAGVDLKALVTKLKLKVAGGHEGLPVLQSQLDELIPLYKSLGSKFITLPSIPGEWREATDFAPLFKTLNEIGKKCYDNGLTLCYHNHEFEFKLKAGDLCFFDALYAGTDPRYLQAQIDTYWVFFAGLDPVDVIKKYAGRCPLIHLKDMPKDFTTLVRPARFAEVGEGRMDMKAIIAASEAAGAKWFIVEQDTCAGPSLDSAALSAKNLKAMGKL
ncbi:MAG: sugar phosphate isomerase/epimerase [Chloroflexi bacterium]|nr:sugar phosphate isomerase/epimerase [Chloroflexota bacterium]